jgi:prepilin-type N-terminal cleavage/methylation domain-containing protein
MLEKTAPEQQNRTPLVDDRANSASNGFTLVEILIVIVIVGILATITVFAVRGITDRGEEASCLTDRKMLTDSADYYMAEKAIDSIPGTGAADANQYERTLVDAQLLKRVSKYHDLTADGTVTSTGVPCT